MAKKPYPLRLPVNLLDLAEAKSREEKVDKSTALKTVNVRRSGAIRA